VTNAQVAAARAAAAHAGLAIEVRADQDGLAALRTRATTTGVLLAMAIVLMAIGLLRGECAGDLRTLTATGAAGRTRRALTATTAGHLHCSERCSAPPARTSRSSPAFIRSSTN
jgi:putative ABC transport system permease protein